MNKPLRAFAFRPILGVSIFLVGVTWACMVLFRGGPATRSSVSATPPPGSRSMVVNTPPPLDFSESQAKQFVDRATEAVLGAVARVPNAAPTSADASAIAREASDTLNLAIFPSAKKYLEYLRERGEADGPFARWSEAERDAYVRSKTESFAGQEVDLANSEARWRYINGREVPVPTERGGYETARRSIDAVENPGAAGLTVLEILVPVPAKTLLKGTQPCRLGIWIGKTREKPSWTTMRIYTYDTPPTAGVMTPPF